MVRSRLALALFGTAALAALVVLTQASQGKPAREAAAPARPAVQQVKVQGQDEIVQEFPVGGEMQTAWKVRYKIVDPGAGLIITGAWLKTSPNAEWLKV